MRKMSKTLLSIVLVIAMVMSFAPISFAEESEESTQGVTISYRTMDLVDVNMKTADNVEKFKDRINFTTTNGFFAFYNDAVNDGYSSKYGISDAGLNFFKYYNNGWVIFEINVPVAGVYKIKTNNNVKSNGTMLSAYVFPSSVTPDATTFTDTYFVGQIDCDKDNGATGGWTGSTGAYVATVDNANYFTDTGLQTGTPSTYNFTEAGKYYIGFKAGAGYVYFSNIYLVSGDGSGNALIGDMTISSDSVKAGETATATATAYKSDDASLATVTYASLNEDVATVDAESGVITTKKAGKATITATAEGSVNVLSKELTVTSADKSEITVEYDITGNADVGKTLKFAEYLTYDKTNDFFEYAKDSVGDEAPKKYRMRYNSSQHIEIYTGHWLILKINVPKAGEYDVKMKNLIHSKGQILNTYIFPTSVTPNLDALSDEHLIGSIDCNNSSGTSGLTTPNSFIKDGAAASYKFPAAGEYYIGFQSVSAGVEGTEYAYVGNIVLDGGSGAALMGGEISGVSDTLEVDATATATATAYLSKDSTAAGNFTFRSSDSSVLEVTEAGAVIAKSVGNAEIIAESAGAYGEIRKAVTVKAAEPGEEVTDTLVNFTFVSSDADAGSVSAEGYPIVGEVAIGTSVKATAEANDGYEFAYWRNGAGTVLSTDATATFKFNTNTAVYAEFIELPDENASEVPVYFYNGNGNL
ncbi:MAG: Ig-like domain-containing protein, partial [Oscillospiraceae bacterium]|nr:Ig-like domain-containing protein [Oscillospiraceae bacterium]